jgi:aryl-alcohol dehydrogenase-like predicted oxidoreductase
MGISMLTRRDWLKHTAAAGTALALTPQLLRGQEVGTLIRRRIPATGEELPIIGLGSSATFRAVANEEDIATLTEVLSALYDNGGRVFDTAPVYGSSEEVAGQIVQNLGIEDEMFWATKVNAAPRGAGSADPAEAKAQIEASFDKVGKDPIDLIQVQSLRDPTQLGILRELKDAGRVRYIGVATTYHDEYDALAAIMRNEPIDFIGTDYAVDNRTAAEMILPLAQDQGIAVLNYSPFGSTRLWQRVSGRDVPAWAREFGAHTWAQFFIKYVAANPAVTVVTPATSNPTNIVDNLGGGVGALPDEATRRRMTELVDALPSA